MRQIGSVKTLCVSLLYLSSRISFVLMENSHTQS